MAYPQPRPWVLDIPLYQGGKSEIKGVNRVIKLSSNEAALGPSPKALAAFAAANTLHRYPKDGAGDLRDAIAEIHGLDPARIICGVGSDEVLCLLCRAFAGPGDEVIHTEHAYSRSMPSSPKASARNPWPCRKPISRPTWMPCWRP